VTLRKLREGGPGLAGCLKSARAPTRAKLHFTAGRFGRDSVVHIYTSKDYGTLVDLNEARNPLDGTCPEEGISWIETTSSLLFPCLHVAPGRPSYPGSETMPAGHGLRARTRDLFSRGFRQKGFIPLTTYLRSYKVGDYVDVKVNSAVHKGMPFKYYHDKYPLSA
jgi:hypothetical protein